MNLGVILAAGIGKRFTSSMHKQYLKINGKEMIYYSLVQMRQTKCIDEIIVVVDYDEYHNSYISKKYDVTCICGGNTRNESISNAIHYIKENYSDCENVIIHDCVRPFIKHDVFCKCISALESYDAVALSSEIMDGFVTRIGGYANRSDYMLIQTPEAFKFKLLEKYFDMDCNDTAIVSQLVDVANVCLLSDDSFNFKITYPIDLFLAEQLVRIDFYKEADLLDNHDTINGKVLLIGASGGVGSVIREELLKKDVVVFSPSHQELDLYDLSVDRLIEVCPFEPDVIINAAAAYNNDSVPLLDSFDVIFNVNLKANLILIEYAKALNKEVHIVLMSSSSSTRGREGLTNYSSAKAALNSIVESQGALLHEQGIYLNALIPEKIDTPLIMKLHNIKINSRELLDAKLVARAVIKCSCSTNYGKLIHIRKGL